MSEDMVHDGPLSWRDVYKAVGDSEARIIKAVQDATAPLTEVTEDHEDRIRELEVHGSAVTQVLVKDMQDLRTNVHSNTSAVQNFVSRESGVFGTLTTLRTLVVVLLSIILTAASTIGALSTLGFFH